MSSQKNNNPKQHLAANEKNNNNSNQTPGYIYALTAGLCAALTAVSAKSGTEVPSMFERIFFITVYIVGNILMWFFFSKSLSILPSTIIALVTNSFANFLFSGIFGFLIFHEELSWNWLLGTTFILLGIALIYLGEKNAKEKQE